MKRLTALIASSLLMLSSAQASLIVFDLTDPSGTGNTAGEALESAGSVTIGGVTLTVSTTPGFGQSGAQFSANSNEAGVNTDVTVDAGGDSASRIDADAAGDEALTFTVTFSSSVLTSVDLHSVDLRRVGGAGAGDAALFTLNSSPTMILETGVAGFNATNGADIWTPTTPISLSSGDTLTFGAQDQIGIEGLTFDVTPIPEPSTILFFSLFAAGAGVLGVRRRKRLSETL